VPNNQAANGQNFDVRMGIFLSSDILQIRLPVRPSEPLYNRLPDGDILFLKGSDDSIIESTGAHVEELPQAAPPNKLLSITPLKFNCENGESLSYGPGCEINAPGYDFLVSLSRADEIQISALTMDGLKIQEIPTSRSDEMMNSLQKCVTALSNNQTYQDLIKLKDQDNAGISS
jgi:hypothetical protein